MTSPNTDKILKRVAGLLAKAESSEYGPERDAFREKAEALMMQHAISEAQVAASKGQDVRAHVIKKRVNVAPAQSAFRDALISMMSSVALNNRCKVAFWNLTEKVSLPVDALLFGMESDVEFVEMLFMNLRLQMSQEMEPEYDDSLTLEDNVYEMRNAGLKWNRLEKKCGLGPNGPAMRAYKRACEERGEEPRKRINPRTVQRNFAEGYVRRVDIRLSENRRRREEDNEVGAALVPVRDAVAEEFSKGTSRTRRSATRQSGRSDMNSRMRGDAAGKRADLGQTRVAGKRGLPS